MNKAIAIGLLVVGLLLVVFGIQAADSLSSDFSRFFSGTPTDKSVWLLLVGTLLGVVGLVGLARPAAR